MPRRRPLSAVFAVAALIAGGGPRRASLAVCAEQFEGVGSTSSAGSRTCGPQTMSTLQPDYVAVNSVHLDQACGRCVQAQWASVANETLRVVGQCADCGVGDLGFAVDVLSRMQETRDAGWDHEPLSITWQFIDCPTRQLRLETTARPANSSTPIPFSPSPSPQNASAGAESTTTSLPTYPSSVATGSTTLAPSNVNTTITTGNHSMVTNTTNSSSNSTGLAGCSASSAENEATRSESAEYTLPCDASKSNTTATDESRSMPTLEPTPLPSPASSAPFPPTPVASHDHDASKSPALVVVAKSVELVGNAKVIPNTLPSSHTPAKTGESSPTSFEKVGVKSTQFSSVSTSKESTAPAKSSSALASAPTTTPRKKVPLTTKSDEEQYAPSTGSSSVSDSKKKKKSDGNDTTSNSRLADDSPLPSHRQDTLLKNPFFLSSMLLAVVGFVGAVTAYRAKEQRQRRHVHQNIAWHQYSQRVQSASNRTPLGTPSPGGLGRMGDAYVVSNTTRHVPSSSSPVITTALSPTTFTSPIVRAQLEAASML